MSLATLRPDPRFAAVATAVFAAALAIHLAYVLRQPSVDPAFAHPGLDAAYYVGWARELAAGRGGPEGAFYLAPLYAYVLGAFFKLFGEHLLPLLVLQQVGMMAAASFVGAVAARVAGRWAGLGAAALVLLYQPVLFFAARPVGEATALPLLALALFLAGRETLGSGIACGFAAGLAALARPNLLLVPAGWAIADWVGHRFRRAGAVVAGVVAVVLPVAVRNFTVSSHPVLISSNGGLTLYHGNGPGALGLYTPPDGFSGDPAHQREEATFLARQRTGRNLDPVESDRWWGMEAVRARLADPADTLLLAVRRLLLVADSYEHGLDQPPMLDENPWRLTLHLPFPGSRAPGGGSAEVPLVPFGLLVGLAAAGVWLRGFRGTGGTAVWTALGICATTPLFFYMSSRYRLPLAVLLAVPAGVGLGALVSHASGPRARSVAAGLGGTCVLVSFLVPFPELRRAEEAVALANRAAAYWQAGDEAAAEREARHGVAVDPASTAARFMLALVLERSGRDAEAEAEYREVLQFDPGHAEAAGNLGGLLVRKGRAAEAVPILRGAIALRPGHHTAWTNLVVALAASGEFAAAREAAREAGRGGVSLDRQLLQTIGAPEAPGGSKD